MTDEQIKQNAEEYAFALTRSDEIAEHLIHGFIAGANSRDEEIGRMNTTIRLYANQIAQQRKEIEQLRNPWHHIGDQMPKDREKIFFRKKDGATYYGWFDERMQCFLTIDPDCTKWTINGVTHWMPIPEIKK